MKLETIRKRDPLTEEMQRMKRKAEITRQMKTVSEEFAKRWAIISKNPKTLEEERKKLLEWKKNLYDSFNKELDQISEEQKRFGSLHKNN